MSDPLNVYFQGRAAANHIVVSDAPRFDLETYIANYHGRTQVGRLLHIGTHSIPLSIEALKFAIKLIKKGTDTKCYKLAVSVLQKVAPNDPDAKLDEEWMDRTNRRVAIETEKMEAVLKSYKHNLIKESIRMGHEDLGNHYYASGELPNAFKSYSRMRDFCTAPKHVIEMSLKIIRVCVEQGNYMSVSSHVSKIGNLQKTPDEEKELRPKLAAAMGLAHLSNGHFLDAARYFLDCPPTLGNSFSDVISASDVAVYGGLCALASMDRNTLKTEVLDSSTFRAFLEVEPQIRRAISYFYTAKYSNCLQILNDYKSDYLLDIHLSRHVKLLYDTILSKSIVQYFIPFSCVTLVSMAEAFDTDEARLEEELIGMIGNGILDARIDTKNRLLVAKETDVRATVHRDTLAMARNYERAARLKLVRVNMVRAGLEVKGAKTQGHSGPPFQDGGRGRSNGFSEIFP